MMCSSSIQFVLGVSRPWVTSLLSMLSTSLPLSLPSLLLTRLCNKFSVKEERARSQRQILPSLSSSIRRLCDWRLSYLGRRRLTIACSSLPPSSSRVFHENYSKFRLKNRAMFRREANVSPEAELFAQMTSPSLRTPIWKWKFLIKFGPLRI